MFPGENEMQTILDRGKTNLPFAVTPGLIPMNNPLSWLDFITIVMVKMLAIGVTLGAGYPGGVIFPLLYTGAAMGQALSILTGVPATVSMMTMMASLEAAVTRTPIGTCIIVLQVRSNPKSI
jgi:H+/Cl- antiporter ClcA